MNRYEFEALLKRNIPRVLDSFYDKAFAYQEKLNAKRSGKAKWEDRKVELATKRMYDDFILSVYNNIYNQLSRANKENPIAWENEIEKMNLYEGLTESIEDLEFEEY